MQKFLILLIALAASGKSTQSFCQGRYAGGSGGGYAHTVFQQVSLSDSCDLNTLAKSGKGKVAFYSIDGKRVLVYKPSIDQWIPKALPAGIYIYRVQRENDHVCPAKKIVITR